VAIFTRADSVARRQALRRQPDKSSDRSTTPPRRLDLEPHGGRTTTTTGVRARLAQRVLAMTTAIWHNDQLGLTIRRSLIAHTHADPVDLLV